MTGSKKNRIFLLSELIPGILILTGLFFFLGYNDILFRGPLGIHFMRQTDSLSFAGIYYNEGFEFFKPGLFNLKNINGHAACEFPILYYITSLIYLLTGQNFTVLKILNYLISIAGVFSIYKLSELLLKDRLFSVLIALVLFTSTVFNYYSLNYLPDSGAFGFIMIGWYFFFRYYLKKKQNSLYTAFIFFTLGSLIKVTYMINPLSVFFLFLLLPFLKKGRIKKAFNYPLILSGLISIIAVAAWNIYMISYNNAYESTSFNTTAMPIWKISREEIAIVWDHFTNYWYRSYLARPVFYLLFVSVAFQILFFKKSDRILSLLTLILLAGNLAFFILFYSQFKDHDYYFITYFPVIILVLLNGFKTFKNLEIKPVYSTILKILIFFIIAWGINYSGKKLRSRYNAAMDDYSRTGLLIQQNNLNLDSLGIPLNAKFIVAPDLTQNGGLLMLNRMGWNIERPKEINPDRIKYFHAQGADFLLLASEDDRLLETGYDCGILVYRGEELSLFKLSDK
ncbi:MAG: glycosyltransferase family 39 protein [Bacteroidales bacterium]|nr:glycosyltransferase family 39 protein [Bacteroidales bacterium]